MNLTPNITSKIGKNLHKNVNHPIGILKNRIYRNFPHFQKFDDLNPVVSISENFDSLLIDKDHPSRSPRNTYYMDDNNVLRTHTSAHQCKLLSSGYARFFVTGDVYRRDSIDKHHYPVFHQMECVSLCSQPERYLEQIIEMILGWLFPKFSKRKVDSYFPFTNPSWEYEIKFKGEWVEILGCGVIQEKIIKNCGLDGEKGWAFGLGLDRMAMMLFEIPDIRLLWSEDERFTSQFKDKLVPYNDGKDIKFIPFSNYPACYKDISFWVEDDFDHNLFCEIIREIGGDLIESVANIDTFVKENRKSLCYRIAYRSVERNLTNEEIDLIQSRVRKSVALELKCELR